MSGERHYGHHDVIWLVYAAIAVGVFIGYTPRQYARVRARHPHTHGRDVAYDVRQAAFISATVAAAWLPVLTFTSLRRAGYLTVTALIGRRRVAAHARAARIEALETVAADQQVIDRHRLQAVNLRAAVTRLAEGRGMDPQDIAATHRALDLYERRLGA
jgi:hypothetical protein